MQKSWKYIAILASVFVSYVIAQEILGASYTSPLFLWSNTKYFSGKNIQVPDIISTDDVQDAFLQRERINPFTRYFQSSNKVEAIIIFIEPQLRTEQVSVLADAYGTKSTGGVLSHLKNLIENSVSSLVAPYVYVGSSRTIGSSIVLDLANSLDSVIIARSAGSNMLSELKANKEVSLKGLWNLASSSNWEVLNNGVTDLIVVCFDSGEEVLNQEVRQNYEADDAFLQILDAFTKSGSSFVAAYTADKPFSDLHLVMPASHPSMAAFEQTHQQRSSNTINDFFPAEVMQGLIFSIPLLIILFIGICCTFNLQSALKFDAEKKNR